MSSGSQSAKLPPDRPLISVVVPCRNAERYIGEALESALGQPGVELEVVVQDGASTDGTLDVLRSIDDGRLRVESAPDSGQSEALNRAVERARGEWILWLNADDLIAPAALAAVAPSLVEPWDLVYGDLAVADADGVQINRIPAGPPRFTRVLSGRTLASSGSRFIRRRLHERVGSFDQGLHYCMDFDWMLRAVRCATAQHVPVTVSVYRLQPDSKTSTVARGFLSEAARVRRRHATDSAGALPAAGWGQLKMAGDILTRELRAPITKRLIARRRRKAAALGAI